MSESAGETPAAPPDPIQDVVDWLDRIRTNALHPAVDNQELAARCFQAQIVIATERQHHAAQLAEKDGAYDQVLTSWAECRADLTAARAEIAAGKARLDDLEAIERQTALTNGRLGAEITSKRSCSG